MTKKRIIIFFLLTIIVSYLTKVLYFFYLYYEQIKKLESLINSFCSGSSPFILFNGTFVSKQVLCFNLVEELYNIYNIILWPLNGTILEFLFWLSVGVFITFLLIKKDFN